LRAYDNLGDIRRMVARSAYAQLRYSPMLLLGTILSMAFVFLTSPGLVLLGTDGPQLAAAAGWMAMAVAFQPILRFYRLSPLWGFALPLIAATYVVFTLDSAVQHWRGQGGLWKGRMQATR
jgi:hypothetical protein